MLHLSKKFWGWGIFDEESDTLIELYTDTNNRKLTGLLRAKYYKNLGRSAILKKVKIEIDYDYVSPGLDHEYKEE